MDTNNLTLLATVFLPVIVDIFIKVFKIKSLTAMKLVAGLLAFAIALISELSIKPAIDVQDLISRFAVVFTLSQVIYRNIYKDTSLNTKLTK